MTSEMMPDCETNSAWLAGTSVTLAPVKRHEQLIERLPAGDAQGAESVTFDLCHSLPTEESADAK
jgi:hypothetical protein